MVVAQGDVFWADLPRPRGSAPGFRRPVLIVQGDAFNRSQIATVLVAPLRSNLRLAAAPGNVVLRGRTTGLPRDSVANVLQLIAIDRQLLTERVGHVPRGLLELVLSGIDLVLGRERGDDDGESG